MVTIAPAATTAFFIDLSCFSSFVRIGCFPSLRYNIKKGTLECHFEGKGIFVPSYMTKILSLPFSVRSDQSACHQNAEITPIKTAKFSILFYVLPANGYQVFTKQRMSSDLIINAPENMMKTVLIEKTSQKLKFYELVITALLFITMLTGFGALYSAIPLAITVWSITGLCLLAFIGIRIAIWWCHG